MSFDVEINLTADFAAYRESVKAAYDKFMEVGGSMAAAREKGFLRSEGKDYVMKDGDIVNFLFNV